MASLHALHLRGTASLLAAKVPALMRTIGSLTQLQKLVLEASPGRSWRQLVAPLTGLTCLEIRDDISAVAVGPQELPALQQLTCEGFIDRLETPPAEDVWYAWVTQRSRLTSLTLQAQAIDIHAAVRHVE